MNILRTFAMGSINPSERKFKRDSEYKDILHNVSDCREKFEATLDDNQKELFEHLHDALLEINSFDEAEQFVTGFKLGSLFMAEIMSGVDEIIL